MTQLASTPVTVMNRLRTAGQVTVVAGVLGALSAVAVIAWPDQVDDARYSYPFGATSYVAAQSWFAIQHVGLVVGLVALVAVVWRSSSRVTRSGLVVTVLGMLGLTGCELFAMTAATARVGSDAANAVDNSYGAPMIAMGIGLVAAGAGLARRPVLDARDRWLVLAMGVYVFVVLFPAVFGPLVVGRIAIGVWMLMFAALGAALVRVADRS